MSRLATQRSIAVLGALISILAGVALAMPQDPDGLRDMCTDSMRATASASAEAMAVIESQTQAELNSLAATSAPASKYFRAILGGVERVEKEQNRALAKMNKEADKCIAKLNRLDAEPTRGEFVEDVRTESRLVIGDAGYAAIDGMHALLAGLLF